VVRLPLLGRQCPPQGAVQSLFEICVEKERKGGKNETDGPDRVSESGSPCALRQPQILRFNRRPSAAQPAGLQIGDVI
jgi:hypothetical protein